MHHAATMLTYASPAHRGRAIVTFTCSALTGGLQPRVLLIDDVDATMDWATKRLQRYYEVVEMLFSPDLFVVGGGISKDHKKFFKYLKLETPMVPAQLLNRAGIIGAAWQAQWRLEHPDATEEEVVKAAKKARDAD